MGKKNSETKKILKQYKETKEQRYTRVKEEGNRFAQRIIPNKKKDIIAKRTIDDDRDDR